MKLFLCLSVTCIFLSGCWDRIELEQRGFVIGVAIDEGANSADPELKGSAQTFKVTFQVVIPAGLKQMGQQGGTLSGKSYFNVSFEGKSMQAIIAKMSTQTSRMPFFEHLKLIVVSEKVAKTKYGFANVLDFFLRNNDARRNVSIMIAKGDASKVFEITPEGEKGPVMFIHSISKHKQSISMVAETRIGDIHEYLLKNESFDLEKVTAVNKDVSLIGAAVMDANKNNLVGFLNERETQGLNLIKPKINGGALEVKMGDSLVVFEIERIERKIQADTTELKPIRFHIHVSIEGRISEAFERIDFLEQDPIEEIQKKIKDEVERIIHKTIWKTQNEYKKDVLGMGAYLKRNKPKVWNKVKNNWDTELNYFSKSEISVTSTVKIRRIGSVNKTEKRNDGQ